jgi:hypothetical protein
MTAIVFCPACGRQREVAFEVQTTSKPGAKQRLRTYRCPAGHPVERTVASWREKRNVHSKKTARW